MKRNLSTTVVHRNWALGLVAFLAVTFLTAIFPGHAQAQDQDQDQDDPPSRVARLGYMEGSVSFQPAGETEWVEAVPNRPMTTGDKLWADRDSRAEVQLGSATIDLSANTGFSFLNLDDRTVQIELSSGTINFRVRGLDRDDVFEIDTPNQAFTVSQPGSYRVEASDDGNYTVVTIRDGAGESTGNGQSYTLHAGQRTTFSGTDSLNAEVQQIGNPDAFDNWSYARDHRYDNSPSARYVSRDVVGFEDLDDNGDWNSSPEYGQVWYPRVAAGWAPYRDGHWAWIDPWGWTWVDDARWGYAPFHYGRWASVRGRWGWIPGPREVRPVYAPALVVFVGGGGVAIGGNMAWFPLGPREVYVPSYRVSRGYVNRVNVSNTVVNTTTITNVYNTTIINKTTNITNVTYANRNVRGAVTAVPQRAFVSAQPVGRAAVRVNERELARAPISSRASVAPVREAVLGVHAGTVNRVAAPPQAIANRAVFAKAAAPQPRPSFAVRQQVLDKNPGQPVARQEMQKLRPANAQPSPLVRQVPQGRPATATPAMARPGNQPGSQPGNQPANQPGNQPANRPDNQPAVNERPAANPEQPGRPQPGNQPAPNNRPEFNRPEANRPQPNQPAPNQPQPNNREPNRAQPNQPAPNQPAPNQPAPGQPQPDNRREPNRPQPNQPAPNNRPDANRPDNARPDNARPEPNRPFQPPVRNERPTPSQPDNRPQPNQPAPNRPESNRPSNAQPDQPAPNNRPETARPDNARPDNARPQPNRPQPSTAQPNNRPEPDRPQPNQPAPNNRPAEQPRNQPAARPDSPAADRPQQRTPPAARTVPQQTKPQTPEEKKREDEQRKRDEKPQPPKS